MFETYLRELRAVVDGTADMSKVDTERTGLVLGTAIRILLEEQHPDGLEADDIRNVITACLQPGIDPDALLIVLAGALGIHPDDGERLAPDVITEHAAVLLTHLAGPRTERALTKALTEIEVAQQMELP